MSSPLAPVQQPSAPWILLFPVLALASLGSVLGLVIHWPVVAEPWAGSGAAAESFVVGIISLINGMMLGAAAGLVAGLGALAALALRTAAKAPVGAAGQRPWAVVGSFLAALLVACFALALLLPSANTGFWVWSAAGYLAVSCLSVWAAVSSQARRGRQPANSAA